MGGSAGAETIELEEELKHARHNLRGKLNALKLCVTALDVLKGREDKLEFLGMIDEAAKSTVESLDEMEAANERAGIVSND